MVCCSIPIAPLAPATSLSPSRFIASLPLFLLLRFLTERGRHLTGLRSGQEQDAKASLAATLKLMSEPGWGRMVGPAEASALL